MSLQKSESGFDVLCDCEIIFFTGSLSSEKLCSAGQISSDGNPKQRLEVHHDREAHGKGQGRQGNGPSLHG